MVHSPKSLAVTLTGLKFVGHLASSLANLSVRTDRVRTAKTQAIEKWTLTAYQQISLFLPEISLLPKIISLLIFAGNLLGSGCGTGAFGSEIASKSLEIAKFPVNFPVSRELQVETGSYLTAHTTKLFKDLAT
jgi:hypothetical protein